MIAHLRGKLLVKHPNQAVVDVGGVGYDVAISVPENCEGIFGVEPKALEEDPEKSSVTNLEIC